MVAALIAAALVVAVLAVALVRARQTRSGLVRRLEVSRRQLEDLQAQFARFVPAQVVEHMIDSGVATRSEKKEVTMLFADLRGFTAMSEGLDPAVLVEILNGYFAEVCRAIAEHRGHVSKFIGDGLLALFGAIEPNPWQSADAVRAALAMRAALGDYNGRLRAQGRPELRVGIGIHRGTVVAGIIGSDELVEYTVIGANVNLASRVESLTREHGVDILVTEEVRRTLGPSFRLRPLAPRPVKGVAEPVATFAVEGIAGEGADGAVASR